MYATDINLTDSSKTSSVINLDPKGDILLGAGAPFQERIRVSSERLGEASLVFKRMLDGQFAESQVKRSYERPQLVYLPHDSHLAILDLCHLLYHNPGGLFVEPIEAGRLYYLAEAADKYDCADKLRLQLPALTQKNFYSVEKSDRLDLKDCVLRAAATYLLHDAKYFRRAAFQLISRSNEPLSSIRKLKGGDIIPVGALLIKTEKRERAQQKFLSGLAERELSCDGGCDSDPVDFKRDLLATFKVDSWPPEFGEVGTRRSRIW